MAPAASSSSSAVICTAQVTYKKQPGHLSLTRDSLTLSNVPGGPPILTVPTNRMIVLFASKPSSPKVALKIQLTPASATSVGEESYNFQFTAGASAVSDRERFKKELGEMVAENRGRTGDSATPAPAGDRPMAMDVDEDVKPDISALSAKDKGKGKAVASAAPRAATAAPIARPLPGAPAAPATDFHLRKLILMADPELMALHRDLVISRQLTESEFWEGRQDLIEAARAANAQLKGRSGGMVDPRPEIGEGGEVTVRVTAQMVIEIFEEYPAVRRAYDENVPDPLDEQQFWTRYFQSKLFNRNRTANRNAVNTVKDDAIFDKYLGEEDDDIEPRNLQQHDIYRLLDLAATEEDQHEVTNQRDVTMRPGRERAALPLMRRYNEHSERLLNQSLGESIDRSRISFDPGNAGDRNYYSDILLDDLIDHTAASRVTLDLGGGSQSASGAETTEAGTQLMDAVRAEQVVRETKDLMEIWEPQLAEFDIDSTAVEASMQDMMTTVRQKADRSAREGSSHNGIARSTLSSLTQVCATSHEFLRLFWGAVLPPKPNDTSALALSSPKERAARAERFKGCLDNSVVRLEKVMAAPPPTERQRSQEEQKRIEAALLPTREAVAHAISYFNSRVGA